MTSEMDLGTFPRAGGTLRTVVIINGTVRTLELIETCLDSGRYEVVFATPGSHPYALVRQLRPSLVVLCLRIEDAAAFQVLSMLRLDEATRRIPVLTYTTEFEGQEVDEGLVDNTDETALVQTRPMLRMH